MNEQAIVSRLFEMRDEAYGALQVKLIPTAPKDSFIGVRTPALRSFAKELYKSGRGKHFSIACRTGFLMRTSFTLF